jgi:hypothetical protein
MKKITAYACSYCGKIYKNKSSALPRGRKIVLRRERNAKSRDLP